jgi:endonuclease VIII
MPEGDTVWRTAKRLRTLDEKTLYRTDFRVPAHAIADFSGRRILTTVPRGKHLLTRLDNGVTIHTHLGMDGGWTVHASGSRWRRPAYTARVVLSTSGGEAVGFNVRCDVVSTADEESLVGHLGPDLLGPDWDRAEAVRRLRAAPDGPIATALLDQRNLAGIGNVYKNEVCFLAGLDPRTPVRQLDDQLEGIVDLAQQLIEANRDRPVRDTLAQGGARLGRPGYWVYRRRGLCLRCETPLRYAELGPGTRERATWWCPSCQPPLLEGDAVSGDAGSWL